MEQGIKNYILPRVEKDTLYYIIENDFKVGSFIEENDNIDNKFYESYNYFTSKEDAEKYGAKLQAYLIELRKEEYIKGE